MLSHIFINYRLSTLKKTTVLFVHQYGTDTPPWLIHYMAAVKKLCDEVLGEKNSDEVECLSSISQILTF